jgi:hypothetical protein
MTATQQEIAEGQKAAVATYMEATKLLVTLSSAFLFAPAGLVALLKDGKELKISTEQIGSFLWAEGLFIASVLAGYVVMSSIAGYQRHGTHDIMRPATRFFSLAQIGFYIGGLVVFALLGRDLLSHFKV